MGLQLTHDMNVNPYSMLLFDLVSDRGASEGHGSHPEQGNISVELEFHKSLTEAITSLLYLEFDKSFLINNA